MSYADFHIHTKYSDGVLDISEIEKFFFRHGVRYFSITDHDDIRSSYYKFENIKHIPGIELSTYYGNSEIHILGYGYDNSDVSFTKKINEIKEIRHLRFFRMLNKAIEKKIIPAKDYLKEYNMEEMSLGRSQLAYILLKENAVFSRKEAFDLYLGEDAPFYEPVYFFPLFEGIEFLRSHCKIVSYAHPGRTNKDELIKRMVAHGLNAIEAYYPFHDEIIKRYYLKIAKKYNIISTGGSDFHKGELTFYIDDEKLNSFLGYFFDI